VTHFNWTPGIGDPTIGGWVTVALYLLASGSCWISAQKLGLEEVPRSNERRAWRAMSVLLLVLGIIKQLNLLTALTAAGRVLARNQGWYEQRQFVQLVFIAVAAMTCLIAAITLLLWARNSPIPTRIALMGTSMVLGFVLIRAVSFHQVDRFIGERVLSLRWNWILEMSGISLVLFASQWRQVADSDDCGQAIQLNAAMRSDRRRPPFPRKATGLDCQHGDLGQGFFAASRLEV